MGTMDFLRYFPCGVSSQSPLHVIPTFISKPVLFRGVTAWHETGTLGQTQDTANRKLINGARINQMYRTLNELLNSRSDISDGEGGGRV